MVHATAASRAANHETGLTQRRLHRRGLLAGTTAAALLATLRGAGLSGPAGHAACPTCAACQACSAVALQPSASLPLAAGFTQAPPRAGLRGHASAAPAPLLKPPIS